MTHAYTRQTSDDTDSSRTRATQHASVFIPRLMLALGLVGIGVYAAGLVAGSGKAQAAGIGCEALAFVLVLTFGRRWR